jgi:hypothetical protein
MNGRLVRKTLSFSKDLKMLDASSVWEDAAYNLTRQVKTLRIESEIEASSDVPVTDPKEEPVADLETFSDSSLTDQKKEVETRSGKAGPSESVASKGKPPGRRYKRRSPAMAAGLTDHIWSIKELLMTVAVPISLLSSRLLLLQFIPVMLFQGNSNYRSLIAKEALRSEAASRQKTVPRTSLLIDIT